MMIRSQTDLSKALEECTSNAACASFLADYDLDEVMMMLMMMMMMMMSIMMVMMMMTMWTLPR